MKFLKKENYYDGTVFEWNMPSGWTCPAALECMVKVHRTTGKFDNRSRAYLCYSAMQERFPAVRDTRWQNFDFIRGGGRPIIPNEAQSIRIHMSGDFFNQAYFDMWLEICRENPDREFWAYTKCLNYWVKRIDEIPENLILTASRGGSHDKLIEQFNLKNVEIIKHKSLAKGRPIDIKDREARKPNVNFVLIDNFAKK
jgi:hypothetical protein